MTATIDHADLRDVYLSFRSSGATPYVAWCYATHRRALREAIESGLCRVTRTRDEVRDGVYYLSARLDSESGQSCPYEVTSCLTGMTVDEVDAAKRSCVEKMERLFAWFFDFTSRYPD